MRDYILRRAGGTSYEGLIRFPRYFEIETVNACNARCPMCTIDDWDRRDGLMSDETFAKIADEIGRHAGEVYRVALYRDGEPLIDKKLPKRVAAMKERGVKRVGISTNVELLTPAKSEALLAAGLDEILMSIDSLKPDVYESIRVGCHYETVMANCQKFIELRNQMGSKCQVWVRMIRQEKNKDEWPPSAITGSRSSGVTTAWTTATSTTGARSSSTSSRLSPPTRRSLAWRSGRSW
jgi:MoaA/NifB/PqqE/SkfB family radical SAM enzyme